MHKRSVDDNSRTSLEERKVSIGDEEKKRGSMTPFEAFKDLLPSVESKGIKQAWVNGKQSVVVVQKNHLKKVKDDKREKEKRALYLKAMMLRSELSDTTTRIGGNN